MKGAIASVEIYAHREGAAVRRLTLVVSEPRTTPDPARWICRVALADLHRPEEIVGTDSVEALCRAVERGRRWIEDLRSDGFVLTRDRAGSIPYVRPDPD